MGLFELLRYCQVYIFGEKFGDLSLYFWRKKMLKWKFRSFFVFLEEKAGLFALLKLKFESFIVFWRKSGSFCITQILPSSFLVENSAVLLCIFGGNTGLFALLRYCQVYIFGREFGGLFLYFWREKWVFLHY